MSARVWLVVGLVGLAGVGPARGDDAEQKKTVKALVEKMQTAILKGEFETVIDLTHPRIVEQGGGKEKAVEAVRGLMKTIKEKGFEFKWIKVGEPTDVVPGGKDLYVAVPMTVEIKSPMGKMVAQGFVVGVSSDAGKTWTFVDGAAGDYAIKLLLPDLPEKLTLPKRDVKIIKD